MAELGMPRCPIFDLFYFLREPGQMFDVKTFFDTINFGLLDDDIQKNILNIVSNVFVPVFMSNTRWADSVKNYAYHNIHMFMSKMTDVHYRKIGLTVLYIPVGSKDISLEKAAQDKELLKRLEAIVVYWTKQVRIGMQEQERSTSEDLLTILDEYDFWKLRYENLLGIQYQLEDPNLKNICSILVMLQSTYIRQFLVLVDEIKSNIEESKSNIDYLTVLIKPVNKLKEHKHPDQIPINLVEILHLIRFIWLQSPYYCTTERITLLCKSLSNQIILQCTTYIDLSVIFDEKKTKKAMKMLEEVIYCLSQYIKAYVLVSESHGQFGDKPWDLSKAPIFNHIDSYMQRCRDLLEICDAMIVFGRYDETEDIPMPQFFGSKGREFDTWAERIEKMFNDVMNEVMRMRDRILNVHAVEWYEDILRFRTKTKDIEVVVENLTNAVFEEVANLEDGILFLACLFNYSKKKTLHMLFEQKTTQIYKMFYKEIQDCKDEIAQDKIFYISLLPHYAGKAITVQMKRKRFIMLREVFITITMNRVSRVSSTLQNTFASKVKEPS
ncbi:unnamed protein product [Brassicogethes aeneus]|uniref:Dynein heavy chain tail domain-containing protein n=1 Tax=Brassicogethes aeneus TaxID=1431903 RepID=A0A9P0FHT2_BRAAE|nr:unnamed protein product [Brassicogethes aeneus]